MRGGDNMKKLTKPSKKNTEKIYLYVSDESSSNGGCQQNCYQC